MLLVKLGSWERSEKVEHYDIHTPNDAKYHVNDDRKTKSLLGVELSFFASFVAAGMRRESSEAQHVKYVSSLKSLALP